MNSESLQTGLNSHLDDEKPSQRQLIILLREGSLGTVCLTCAEDGQAGSAVRPEGLQAAGPDFGKFRTDAGVLVTGFW